jgi:hypothetical protein
MEEQTIVEHQRQLYILDYRKISEFSVCSYKFI